MRWISFLGLAAMCIGTATTGCASKVAESEGTTSGASTVGCTAEGACPKTFAELARLSSAELGELFEGGDTGESVPDGLFAGQPLCFPAEIPPAEQFPAGARAEQGFDTLVGAMRRLTQAQLNRLAGFIWHGKRFTAHTQDPVSQLLEERPGDFLFVADVINNIGRTDVDFSAEASLLVDRPHRSLDLDYSLARTGLQLPGGIDVPGITSVSLPILRHVWDRVRLVNAEKKLYLGRAYVVAEPGTYDAVAVPVCWFALTPKT